MTVTQVIRHPYQAASCDDIVGVVTEAASSLPGGGDPPTSIVLISQQGDRHEIYPPVAWYSYAIAWDSYHNWLIFSDGDKLARMRSNGTQIQTLPLTGSNFSNWYYFTTQDQRWWVMSHGIDLIKLNPVTLERQLLLENVHFYSSNAIATHLFQNQLVLTRHRDDKHLYWLDMETGATRQLPEGDFIGWSPDGKWILYANYHAGKFYLHRIPPISGHPELVMSVRAGYSHGIELWAWTPDHKQALVQVDFHVVQIDWETLHAQIAAQVFPESSFISWTTTPNILLFDNNWGAHSDGPHLSYLDLTTGISTPIGLTDGTSKFGAWLPDHQHFVISAAPPTPQWRGEYDLYLASSSDDTILPITNLAGDEIFVAWLPCRADSFIFYNSNNGQSLHRVNLDGTGLQQLTDGPYDIFNTWLALPDLNWHPLPLAIGGLLTTLASFIRRR